VTTQPDNAHRELGDAVDTSLNAALWRPSDPCAPSAGVPAKAWTSLDRTVRLLITSTPGGPTTAVLTGHPVGQSETALWTISILDPTADQVFAAARAAAKIRIVAILRMVDNLKRNFWSEDDDAPTGTLFTIRDPDHRRSIARLDDADQPGGWRVTGDGLNVQATDGTPESILEALALTAVPDDVLICETPPDTAVSSPPVPDRP
jgi:hypothetical protein